MKYTPLSALLPYLLLFGFLPAWAQEDAYEFSGEEVEYADTKFQAAIGNLIGFGAGLNFKVSSRFTADALFGIRSQSFMLSPYPQNRLNLHLRANYEFGRFFTHLGWYYGTFGLGDDVKGAQINSFVAGFGGYFDKNRLWSVEVGIAPFLPFSIETGGRVFKINGIDPFVSYMVRKKFREAKKPEVKGVY